MPAPLHLSAESLHRRWLRFALGLWAMICLVGFVRTAGAAGCAPIPEGLVHWWRGDGTTAEDIAGQAAILQGGAGYGGGYVGQAFYVANDAILRVPGAPSLEPQNLTIEAWVYAMSVGTYADEVGPIIVAKDIVEPGNPTISYTLTGPGTSGQFRASVGLSDGSDPAVMSSASFGFNQWHHVAMTWDGTTLRLYVDGTLQGEINPGPAVVLYTGSDVGIGRHPFLGGRGFHGLIDEVAIYSRALLATEIQAIHAAGPAGKCPSQPEACVAASADMLHWWGGNGNVSDLAGSRPLRLEAGAAYGAGWVGQALQFQSGGIARTPSDATLQPQSFTIETWVFPYSVGSTADEVGGVILSKDNSNSGEPAVSYALAGPGTTGRFIADVGLVGGNLLYVMSPHSYQFNTWHHLAMSWNGSTLRLYVNGFLEAETSVGPAQVFYSGSDVGIGRHSLGGARAFHGLIDEPTMYSSALSPEEINAIVVAGARGKCLPQPTGCLAEPDDLWHWWPGENSGEDAKGDADLAFEGAGGFLPGLNGQAFDLGGNSMLRVPSDPSFESQEFSFEAWVYPRSVGSLVDTLGGVIASKDTGVANPGISFSLTGPGTTGLFRCSVGLTDGSDPAVFSTNPFGFGVWHHVAMTWDRTNLTLYVNGNVEGQVNLGPKTVFYNGTDLGIGRHPIFGTRGFDGLLDEPSYYGRALTGPEVTALYAAGAPGKCEFTIPPEATIVEFRDSHGDLIPDSVATIEYQPNSTGGWLVFGDGVLNPDGREWSVIPTGVHRFRLTHQGVVRTIQTNTVLDRVVVFQTVATVVRLRDSESGVIVGAAATVEWQPGSTGSYRQLGGGVLGADGNLAAEILPGTHRFRLTYQGMAIVKQQNVGTNPIVDFATLRVEVRLRNSLNEPIAGAVGTAEWQPLSTGSYATFGLGPLDTGGNVAAEILPGTHRFRLTYQGMAIVKQQNVGTNPIVDFATLRVEVRLRNSLNEPIAGAVGTAEWQPLSTGSYATFGSGPLDAGGNVAAEVLPGTHRFRLTYQGMTTVKQQNVGTSPIVDFATLRVEVRLRNSLNEPIAGAVGTAEWQPLSTGSYAAFGAGSLDAGGNVAAEVLPGTHRFRLNYQNAVLILQRNVATDPVVLFQTIANTVELRNSANVLIPGATAAIEWQSASSGEYESFGDGTIGPAGATVSEVVGLMHRYRLTYQGATLSRQQNPAVDPTVVFRTVNAIVELRDGQGQLITGSNAVVTWQPGSTGGYGAFGLDGLIDPTGTESLEVLPLTHRFRVTYQGVTLTVQQNVAVDPVVVLTFP